MLHDTILRLDLYCCYTQFYDVIQCVQKVTDFPGSSQSPASQHPAAILPSHWSASRHPGPHWQHIGPYPNTGDIFFASRLEICPQGLSVATTKWIEAVISSLKVSLDGCLPSPIPQLLCFMCVCMCLCLHM